MDNRSRETLQRVEDNDSTLETLLIGRAYMGLEGALFSSVGDDFSRLGDYIGRNTHLTELVVAIRDGIALDVTNNEFYGGLKVTRLFISWRLI